MSATGPAHDSKKSTAHYDAQRYERRREKSKSSGAYNTHTSTSIDPNLDYPNRNIHQVKHPLSPAPPPPPAAAARPQLHPRTTSAPLLQTADRGPESLPIPFPHSPTRTRVEGQDEDEANGVVGALRTFQPFLTPELSEPLPVLNIAVIGAEGVGKSTFVQKALELPTLPPSQAAERKIPVDGSLYLVRLLELPLEDIDIDDDDTINWPDTIEDKMMPRVDGALALYDVQDKASVQELPDMLNAITKASIPTVLVSCKCDTPPSEREIDPFSVEESARRAIRNIDTVQISERSPESNKRGILMLLSTIVTSNAEDHAQSASANRRRAQSNAVRPVSPRLAGHLRASSEFSYKDQRHTRHDSSLAGQRSNDRLRIPREEVPMHGSFLFEESTSEHSPASSRSSSRDHNLQAAAGASSISSIPENGTTFDELVDRLLAQPTSRAELKFAAMFLALFRNFAAPGQLFEAIVERFDALERNGCPQILKTQTQLRYVGLIEQWVGEYPGDFAFPKTKRRLRIFVAKLAALRIFAQAARELNIDLEAVREDDDTNWAFCDRDREASRDQSRSSLSSTASTLIDDPMFTFEQELSGSTINDDVSLDGLPKYTNPVTVHIEQAQRQANLLQASPQTMLTKVQWRALMEQPDDLIARELTRMDWIMFSSIRSRDLIRDVSLSKDQKSTCRNLAHVNRMIDHFNQLAAWVANYILLRDKPKHRALMLEKLMRVARKLRELNNYNSLGAIIAGIKSTSIHRLAQTRELIPPAIGKDWMKLEILMSPSRSHSAYRLAWENSSSERIPYLPLHRRDLAAAEEGNKTFLDASNKRVNWKKFEIMGEVVVGLQKAQGIPYEGLKGNDVVRELVLDGRLEKEEEKLYQRSLAVEPAATGGGLGSGARFMELFRR